MKAPIYVRALNPAEQAGIEAGLRSSHAFTLRRSQILLASSREQCPREIARNLGCATQTVRNAIHAFEQKGLDCLKQESSRPKTVQAQFDQAKCEALRALLHQSPRTFGKMTSCWTLALAAEVCFEQGLTVSQVSIETIRQALGRLGVGWQRAKNWITSPDPEYARKKNRRDTLIAQAQHYGWEVGYLDEVWWSRVSQPNMHSWSEKDEPLRLHELSVDKTDPDPKALACYGMLTADSGRMRLRFVSGRPVSQVTIDFLEWLCVQVQAEGKGVLVLIWDNASWHVSKQVRTWLRQHNQTVLQDARTEKPGVRIIPCWLPTKSPWLNRIEPKWVHGKRAIVEPARLLTAEVLRQRICDYFGCEQIEHLVPHAEIPKQECLRLAG
jgi:transposase